MNKIILKIKLLNKNGLYIELLHIDNCFRYSIIDKKNCVFYGKNNIFMLYSTEISTSLLISQFSLRIPNMNNATNNNSTHYFDTEKERYDYLKYLSMCLIQWNDEFEPFKNEISYPYRNRKILMNDNYWVL